MPTATSVLAIPIAWDLPHDLARRFTTILPAMTLAEALAAARLQRIAARPGRADEEEVMRTTLALVPVSPKPPRVTGLITTNPSSPEFSFYNYQA